jgi:hypothetical protein
MTDSINYDWEAAWNTFDIQLEFAKKLGGLLNVPLVTCEPKPGEEFQYPKGERDALSADDNQHQLNKWKSGWAIMARTGGPVAVVDADPRNGNDIEKTRQLLYGLGVRVFAEIATPGVGRHFYIAGHPELPSTSNLNGWPGIDVLSFGKLVFLPGTQRPKYDGAGYRIIFDDLDALADGGDRDGAEAFADWVADRRGDREQFATSPLWMGGEPDTRQAAYLAKMLAGIHHDLSPMCKGSGRNTAVYSKALRCGNYIAGAGLNEAVVIDVLLDASRQNGLVQDDGERSVLASINSGLKNGKARPRAVPEARDPFDEGLWSPNGSTPANSVGPLDDPMPPDDPYQDQPEPDYAAVFAEDVEKEARRLRIREAAQRKIRTEQSGPLPPFDAGTLRDMLARPRPPQARVDGLIPWEASTLIPAQRKTGKTTLLLNLSRSFLTGEPLLGTFEVQPVDGLVALLNYEVSGDTITHWADEAGLDPDRFFLVNLRGRRNPLADLEDRGRLAEILRSRGTESLLVDPFGRAYTGASQNDSAEVGAWLAELDRFTRSDIGAQDLILTTHAGWNQERTRGSSALEDWADSIITMIKDDEDGARYIRAIGRDVDLEEDQLIYDASTRTLTLAGTGSRKASKDTQRNGQLDRAVYDVVTAEPGLNLTQIGEKVHAAGVSFQRGDIGHSASRLEEAGHLRMKPGRRNAKQYYPTENLLDGQETTK